MLCCGMLLTGAKLIIYSCQTYWAQPNEVMSESHAVNLERVQLYFHIRESRYARYSADQYLHRCMEDGGNTTHIPQHTIHKIIKRAIHRAREYQGLKLGSLHFKNM